MALLLSEPRRLQAQAVWPLKLLAVFWVWGAILLTLGIIGEIGLILNRPTLNLTSMFGTGVVFMFWALINLATAIVIPGSDLITWIVYLFVSTALFAVCLSLVRGPIQQ